MSAPSSAVPRLATSAADRPSSGIMSTKGACGQQHLLERPPSVKGTKRTNAPPHLLERPPPPVVGKVTHHSIELYWEDAMKKESSASCARSDGRVQVTVQEEDRSGGWGNVYTGFSKKHVCTGLEPWSPYKYRIRFKNNHGYSEWSASFTVSTTKEPLTGEHLHKAVLVQNLERAEQIIDSGELQSIDVYDNYGLTPLMQAAQKGYTDFVESLVERGAEVDKQNDSGKTAMMLAAFAGKLDAVKELRHHKARYDIHDRGGSTALHWAMDGKSLELIDYMIEDGANLESLDYNKWTPLLRVAAVGGNREVARRLIRSGADVNRVDSNNKTALMIAVVNGHQALVDLLLSSGADLKIQNEFGKTAYEMAIACEKRRVCKVIEEYMERKGMKSYSAPLLRF